MAQRPNVLFFIADQLRADHVGFGGNDVVRTPNLDALARCSAVFDEAYVANPTCMPNRASLLTGRWPSAHGTRCNGIPLAPESSTFVRQLVRAGYRTGAVGKLHHQNMGWDFEPEQLEQIRRSSPSLLDDAAVDAVEPVRPDGWDQWENRARHERELVELPADYYGYQDVDLVIGHGDRPGGHWAHWVRAAGVDPDEVCGRDASSDPSASWEQVYTSSIPPHLHPSSYIGQRAAERIRDAAHEEDPFFLFVSFPDPHHPFAPPREYAYRYDPSELPLPVGFHDDHHRSPEHLRIMAERRGIPAADPTLAFAVTEEQYRAAAAAQYGLIELMDEQIGRVLEALEQSGQADNTIIVFTADHGDLFGDHGLMLKHFVHYRAVTRVPLLIHDPRRPANGPRRFTSPVSSTDLAPTIMEWAGARAFRGIQGRSLNPLLSGSARPFGPGVGGTPADPGSDTTVAVDETPRPILIEEDEVFAPDGLPAPVRMRTVITSRGRLTKYIGTDQWELYDHQWDPDELHNLAGVSEADGLRRELEDAMLAEIARLAETGIAPTSAA